MHHMFRAIRRVLDEHPECKAVYPIHMNPVVRQAAEEELGGCDQIHIIEPIEVFDCHNFEARSFLCLTDSGGIQEECPSYGVPVLVMRDTTERPEGVDAGTLKLVGTDEETIYSTFKLLLEKHSDYVTGSPMAEVLHANLAAIEQSDILKRLGLEPGRYMLLSAHREENIDTEKNFHSLFTAINQLAEKYDMPILYSCHPRSRKRLEESGFQLDHRVMRHEPLGFHDYNHLQMNAFAVISDSGTLPEESSFFTSIGRPFPAVCIRTSTERPEALDKACFILAGIDEVGLLQAVDTAVTMNQEGDYGIPVPDYVEENVSTKVVKIIQSYTGVVNKMVWRKF